MLTKDMMKFRIKAGKVTPNLLRLDDETAIECARSYLSCLENAVGSTLGELELAWQEKANQSHFAATAFQKLITDKTKLEETDDSWVEKRRAILTISERVRKEMGGEKWGAWRAQVKEEIIESGGQFPEDLYADLPHLRKVISVPSWSSEQLMHRYNVAQYQGLLLHAYSLQITLKSTEPQELRYLLRMLKFLRLMVGISETKNGAIVLNVDGPLSVSQQSTAYGLKLARFFPHLVRLKDYTCVAEVKVRKKNVQVSLDHKRGLVSHITTPLGYVPPEIKELRTLILEEKPQWKVGFGDRMLALDGQSLHCPDLTVENEKGAEIYVEFFHRWHRGELMKRLQAFENQKVSRTLLLGVEASLKSDKELSKSVFQNPKLSKNIFMFRDYPSKRKLVQAISSLYLGGKAYDKLPVMQEPLPAETQP